MVKNVKNDVGSEPIRIRAHHLLCIQGFKGLGYSKEFTKNMAMITKKIRQKTYSEIKVIIGADAICACCPHFYEGVCNIGSSSSNPVMLMDYLVLLNLGIEEGSVISYEKILSLTLNLNRQKVNEICGNCSWREECLFFQEKMY
jgi:uncharacterized protein